MNLVLLRDNHNNHVIDFLSANSGNLTDMTVISGVDNRRFSAHRLVLAAASPLLRSIMHFAQESVTMTLADWDGECVENLLALCYTGATKALRLDQETDIRDFFPLDLLSRTWDEDDDSFVAFSETDCKEETDIKHEPAFATWPSESRVQHGCGKIRKKCSGKRGYERSPKVDFPFREDAGMFFCTHEDCIHKEPQPFKWKGGLQSHWLALHATEADKTYGCSYCVKKFASNNLRNKHEKSAHVLPYPCQDCGKRFAAKTALTVHMRVHTGERPFVCEVCGVGFIQKDNLKQHTELRHSSGEPVKKHKCENCGKLFRLRSNLKRHRLTHVAGKQFVCEECGKGYKERATLNQHMETHSGNRVSCETCGLTFSSRLYLRRHRNRKHPKNGILPFSCQLCDKAFHTNYLRKEHARSAHQLELVHCPSCNKGFRTQKAMSSHLEKECPPNMQHYT